MKKVFFILGILFAGIPSYVAADENSHIFETRYYAYGGYFIPLFGYALADSTGSQGTESHFHFGGNLGLFPIRAFYLTIGGDYFRIRTRNEKGNIFLDLKSSSFSVGLNRGVPRDFLPRKIYLFSFGARTLENKIPNRLIKERLTCLQFSLGGFTQEKLFNKGSLRQVSLFFLKDKKLGVYVYFRPLATLARFPLVLKKLTVYIGSCSFDLLWIDETLLWIQSDVVSIYF